jgi:ligand-binding sensor domain-containing protein
MDTFGRIWISTSRGLSVVDPIQAAKYSLPAIVRIEGVTADGSALDLQGAVRIAGTNRRITLSYAGLSLTVPEWLSLGTLLPVTEIGKSANCFLFPRRRLKFT